ncbi:MAG: glycosyltransferase [Bacteroidales bacterium]|nr:glycosyltransferase [Bacteroidales bacterium]
MNSSHPAISVIIPVYKVERWLPRCLDSLLAQTCPDWEAICVDDGSPDGSGAILDDYASRDARFRVIHKVNEGVSVARNVALELAQGEFLLFVDSDDFIHPQLMELCLTAARRDESDLVTFTYDRSYRLKLTLRHFLHLPDPGVPHFRSYEQEPESVVTDDIFAYATEFSHPKDMFDHTGKPIPERWWVKHCYLCLRMYRTECVKNLRFLPIRIYEDFPWWSQVMLAVRRTTILNLPLYYYYPNFTGSTFSSSAISRIESLQTMIAAVEQVYTKDATPYQLARWREHFLRPVKEKLARKLKQAGGKARPTGA